MIKLIATDLDFTLLGAHKEAPAGFCDAVRKLYANGIRFALVSGRERASILQTKEFREVRDLLLFATDNGALNYDGEKLIGANPLSPEDASEIERVVKGLPEVNLVFSGENYGYVASGYSDSLHQELLRLTLSEENIARCFRFADDPLKAMGTERIGKLALYHPSDAETATREVLAPFRSRFQIFPSELQWVNVMKPGVDKGFAMESLQNHLGVTPDECMVFGDYLNDCSMFLKAEHTYAMANAHPDLKKMAKHIAPANTEDGVMQILRETFSFLQS